MDYEFDPALSQAIAYEALQARAADDEKQARPFRFEDLNGRPEPESWGPVYPKTASAAVEKWRAIARGRVLTDAEKREHGRAVGEWIRALNRPAGYKPLSLKSTRITCAQIRARNRAAFEAAANADRATWASGRERNGRIHGSTGSIERDYALAMAAKRARLAERLAAAVPPAVDKPDATSPYEQDETTGYAMTADEIRQARAMLGLTQGQFGKAFDVHTRTVSAWENGARDGRPSEVPRSIAVLVRLALKDPRVRRELGINSPKLEARP